MVAVRSFAPVLFSAGAVVMTDMLLPGGTAPVVRTLALVLAAVFVAALASPLPRPGPAGPLRRQPARQPPRSSAYHKFVPAVSPPARRVVSTVAPARASASGQGADAAPGGIASAPVAPATTSRRTFGAQARAAMAATAAAQLFNVASPAAAAAAQPAHGTCGAQPQDNLKWGANPKIADRICCFNSVFAEPAGYYTSTSFVDYATKQTGPITFYDSVTGKPLFIAPKERSMEAFLNESRVHGWPSFRDNEVVWENVREVRGGETVSKDGTHLGHNLPDGRGNRYCINLVSIAGQSA